MIALKLPMAPMKDPESINVFLLNGDPLTLVDTGFKTDAAWAALNSQLNNHGYKLGDIKQLVLTHAHPDHYGLAGRIAEEIRVEIIAHKDAAPRFLFGPKDWIHDRDLLYSTLKKTGAPQKPLADRFKPKGNGDPLVDAVAVSRTIEDGDRITGGSEDWEVMELPGHAPGVIGLFNPDSRELITSDHLLPETNSRPGLYHTEENEKRDSRYMGDYVKTMQRITQMELSTAWPSHGESILDVRSLVLEWIGKHHRRAEEIAAPLADADLTAYDLWKAHFPKILPFDPVKGLVEIITYLDLLLYEEKLSSYEQENLIYYRLIH